MRVQESDLAAAARILVVDDLVENQKLLTRILERAGYRHIRCTADGREVAEIVAGFRPDLILLDLHMPAFDGFQVLQQLAPELENGGYLPVLMLTGDATTEAKRSALSLGAQDFLKKPFDSTEVLLRIRNLLETRFLYRSLEIHNATLENRVEERTAELRESQLEIVERLAFAAEIRDDDTGRHTQRVGELSARLAAALQLDAHKIELIRRAAPLHDVGKIGIPDSILLKPGRLSPEEVAIIRTHAAIGARILSGGKSELVVIAASIALNHHERWDGSGYPGGLAGDAIPIEAQIVAVADVFDALTHRRPYRAAWPVSAVLDEIERTSGSHFSPDVVSELTRSGCYRQVTPTPAQPVPHLTGEF
ncbi:MAG: response regulator [Gemmatimonadaceae bacterium]|nr:response regulator [Gemmatimonadaceae bacterium]